MQISACGKSEVCVILPRHMADKVKEFSGEISHGSSVDGLSAVAYLPAIIGRMDRLVGDFLAKRRSL